MTTNNVVSINQLEEWKNLGDVVGFPQYSVSNLGRIRTDKTGRIRKFKTDKDGYQHVVLSNDGQKGFYMVHRLVALAFIPITHELPADQLEVNHLGNKDDNRVYMLEWTTKQENYAHAVATGRMKIGENHHRAVLSDADVMTIRAIYKKNDCDFGQSALARKYGVTQGCIGSIVNGKSRKQVAGRLFVPSQTQQQTQKAL